MSMSFGEKISGRTVLDASGQIVGTVEDLLVDDGSWRVDGFRIRLKREIARDIGASAPWFRSAVLDVPTRMVQGVADALILSVRVGALHELVAASQTVASGSELTDAREPH